VGEELPTHPEPAPPGLAVDAVEWLPTGADSGLLRVRGRWGGEAGAALPGLLAGERRFESLPDARPGGAEGAWRASYLVPAVIVGEPMEVQAPGGERATLPAPELVADTLGGQVIDHPALAERRARDAEVSAGEAARARSAVAELESALAGARSELAAARAEAEASTQHLRAQLAAVEEEADRRIAAAETARSLETVARAALEDELDRERLTLAVALEERDHARQDLAIARAATLGAQAALASLKDELEAERSARRDLESRLAAALGEAERAGASLQARVADLERRAAAIADPDRLERLAREQAAATDAARAATAPAAADLAARLDAAAEALRSRTPLEAPPAPELAEAAPAVVTPVEAVPKPVAEPAPAPAPAPVVRHTIVSPAGPPPRADVVGTSKRGYPVLRGALVKLAHDDPDAAGRILAALLPAQGPLVAGPLSYDLTIRETGTFAVTVTDGSASAEAIGAPRGRREAAFHLRADALTLAELLAGVEHRIGRFSGRARISGRRRSGAPLRALPTAELTLADAARAGARLEPALLWQALSYAVHPTWTRGLAFTVAHELTGDDPQTFYLTARDGGGLAASTARPEGGAQATVATSRAAFDRLVRDEPHPRGDRPAIRGDRDAVAALLALIDRTRRG
jgi:hypothetical protein